MSSSLSTPRSLPAPLARTALVDDVYESLKAWIMDTVRETGVRANIDALARMLGVSPTPVREALARLEADGLVAKEPSRGYTVTPPLSTGHLSDLFEFRQLIEPWAAGRAAATCSHADAERLRAELASCPSAPEAAGYEAYRAIVAHDERFHDLVLELAGNEEVRRAFARTHCHLHLFRLSYGADMGRHALAEHGEIVDAIVACDASAAAGAMERHLQRSSGRLAAKLDPD